MTVLIVDDEDGIRETLEDALADEGYVAAVARNGVEALRQIAALDDLCAVILDIMMPELDGIAVWQAMQRDPKHASIPVLFTTSDPTRAPPGATILRKPVDLDVLLDKITLLCPHTSRRSGS